MTAATSHNVQQNSFIPSKWEKTGDSYSSDDLINAYLKGKDDQRGAEERILMKALSDNVNKSTTVIENFAKQIKESFGVTVKGINLKIQRISYLEFLFVVDSSSYLSDDFKKVYDLSKEIKAEHNSDTLCITLTFMPDKKSIDMDAIHSDGYILEYVKEKTA